MNTLHSLDDGSLSFLISAFVITWIVALTPPLVIRYAIARHPLSKRAASWIAAGWCGALWIADQILIHSEGGQAGKITAIYIVMFGVTRWVMNRGHTGPSSIHVETSPTNLNDSVQFDSSQRQQSAC